MQARGGRVVDFEVGVYHCVTVYVRERGQFSQCTFYSVILKTTETSTEDDKGDCFL